MAQAQIKNTLSARITEYEIPPIRDALVLGREAPIGCHAVRRALSLLVKAPFAHIELDDETISDILIRESLLRRMPREQVIAFVLDHIKPMMGVDEVLQLNLEVEVNVTTGPT
jgi:hypothetical protein